MVEPTILVHILVLINESLEGKKGSDNDGQILVNAMPCQIHILHIHASLTCGFVILLNNG